MSNVRFNRAWSPMRSDQPWMFWTWLAGALVTGYLAGLCTQPDKAQLPRDCLVTNNFPAMPVAVITKDASPGNSGPSEKIPPASLGQAEFIQRALEPQNQTAQQYSALQEVVKRNANLRQDLIKRFETTHDPQIKTNLLNLLIQANTPDVKAFADGLVMSSDPAKRTDGFRILTNIDQARLDPGTRRQLISALDKEADANALEQLIAGMSPGAARPPQETSAVVSRLSELARSPTASIRAAAVGSVARWSEGAAVEGVIVEALNDADPAVSTAAVYASLQAGLRTPAVKSLLFQLASQVGVSSDYKRNIVMALGSYNLNAQDFDRLVQLRRELGERDM